MNTIKKMTLQVPLENEEFEMFEQLFVESGMRSRADFIRSLIAKLFKETVKA